MYYTKRQCT